MILYLSIEQVCEGRWSWRVRHNGVVIYSGQCATPQGAKGQATKWSSRYRRFGLEGKVK